ncbi:DUF4817 domain-containing protein [Trichonephila clavipes]|nr:DUF4817 domain-containing protein [Trichonephila clavipes]
MQLLLPNDPPRRVAFAQWFVNLSEGNMHFASSLLFYDEATFSCEGMFQTHNAYMCALSDPHSTRPRASQQLFTFNVWRNIVGDSLLAPYALLPQLDFDKYLVFLQEVLPELFIDVPAPARRRLWFLQDGAPFHYGRCILDHLDQTRPNRCIERGALPEPLIYLIWIFSQRCHEERCVRHAHPF